MLPATALAALGENISKRLCTALPSPARPQVEQFFTIKETQYYDSYTQVSAIWHVTNGLGLAARLAERRQRTSAALSVRVVPAPSCLHTTPSVPAL